MDRASGNLIVRLPFTDRSGGVLPESMRAEREVYAGAFTAVKAMMERLRLAKCPYFMLSTGRLSAAIVD